MHYHRTAAKSETGRLKDGLLHPPVNRTVRAHTAATEILRCYTVNEAAKALGRDHKTFRRWIKDGSIPEPLLIDDQTGYRQYSMSEIDIIRQELNEHEDRGYLYLFAEHETCIRQIAHRIDAFRRRWCNF